VPETISSQQHILHCFTCLLRLPSTHSTTLKSSSTTWLCIMAPSGNRPRWQRIYRQTLTLIYKNLLIFYKTPIATLLRALIFPVVFTIIMCKLQNVADFSGSSPYTGASTGSIASQSTPIQDLDVALKAAHSQRLVFVRNGINLVKI